MNNSIQPSDIREALFSGALEHWFQPKVSFLSGKISGGEALIRWRRKDGCVLPAVAWLPIAKKHDMMQEIATVMFPLLADNIAAICRETTDIKIAFNMDAGDLESTNIVDQLLSAVHAGKLNPAQIEIELTETALPRDGHAMEDNIMLLTATGISLAMDDFGTGFSSLDTLRKLPFSTVKIDQGVVMTMQDSVKSSAIVLSSIRMAYEMGLNVIAEGVESEEVFDILQQAGCSEAQGFWISRALPLDQFISFVNSGKRWLATPIGQLRHVEIDHLLWCKNILSTVFGNSNSNMDLESVLAISNDQTCRLGKWLEGENHSFATMPEFLSLTGPHQEVHKAGYDLVFAARDGVSMRELQAMAVHFNRKSEALMIGLQSLEIQVLMASLNDATLA